MRLIIATHNRHKSREFGDILGSEFEVTDLSDFVSIKLPPETGLTFEENAAIKAQQVSEQIDDLVLADDSGLEVDALNGAPGVFSARYAGEPADGRRNIDKLLRELRKADPERRNRSARFRCVVALARRGELLKTFSGTVEGVIVDSPRGSAGFGYDPIFVPEGFDATFAELPPETKHRFSHRGRATGAAMPFLRAALQTL